jgi:hypothetical protein
VPRLEIHGSESCRGENWAKLCAKGKRSFRIALNWRGMAGRKQRVDVQRAVPVRKMKPE